MAQGLCVRAWDLHVERGPEWLFVRPCPVVAQVDEPISLAEQVWSLLEQTFTYRLVLELTEIEQLDSLLIEQLLWLHKQIHSHDGMMRICGLSPANQQLLKEEGLDGYFAHSRNRETAVMGGARPAFFG